MPKGGSTRNNSVGLPPAFTFILETHKTVTQWLKQHLHAVQTMQQSMTT